jgi:putative ABC transport system permease protein
VKTLLRDARVGLRLLKKHPGFTAAAVITLAVGISATTAIYSVVHATFLEPLPYRDADRLAMVWGQNRGERAMVGAAEFLEWKARATVFEELNAWSSEQVNVTIDGRPELMTLGPATPGFLAMLGYGHPLALGRDFREDEGVAGKNQIVIITHRLWRERLGSDPGIIGRQIRIDRQPHTIVGVLGAGPADENENQLYKPDSFTASTTSAHSRWVLVMGRLKADETFAQASAHVATISRSLERQRKQGASDWSASVEPFRNNFLSADTKRGLWLLLAAVGGVLLIACANVANLLLARGTARHRELAVRASLGASRARIVGQMLIESLVLAALGGTLGMLLGWMLLPILVAMMPPFMLPTEAIVRLNVPVLMVATAACMLAGIVSGAAPAWHASRATLNETLKESSRSVSGSGHRLRQGLVIVEFALALTLLAGGGLAMHTLDRLANRDLGFTTSRVLTFSLRLEPDRFDLPERGAAFARTLIERIEALPGVLSASASTAMPVLGPGAGVAFELAGKPIDPQAGVSHAGLALISPSYVRTFGLRMLRGRTFTEHDRAGTMPVALVNETLARRIASDDDALSERLIFSVSDGRPGTAPQEWQIVGVYADVPGAGLDGHAWPEIAVPFWQIPSPAFHVGVRTTVDPSTLQRSVESILRAMDPELPMASVKTMDQIVAESLVRDRFNTALFGSFALVGLTLAAFGIYGVMSFTVAQRTHEIGLRMALGAGRARILRQIVSEGLVTAGIGAAVGSVGAFYMVRTMKGLVSGMGDLDPIAFLAVAATLLATALVACAAPAFRAATLNPVSALRQE